jgi:hypothetical protein
MPAAGIGIEIAADEAEFGDASLQLFDRALQVRLRRLGQHTDGGKAAGIKLHATVDKVVVRARPGLRYGFIADMMRHRRSAWGEDRHVGAALAEQAQLVLLQRLANLVIRMLG